MKTMNITITEVAKNKFVLEGELIIAEKKTTFDVRGESSDDLVKFIGNFIKYRLERLERKA